jgi:hypothetical protein
MADPTTCASGFCEVTRSEAERAHRRGGLPIVGDLDRLEAPP